MSKQHCNGKNITTKKHPLMTAYHQGTIFYVIVVLNIGNIGLTYSLESSYPPYPSYPS